LKSCTEVSVFRFGINTTLKITPDDENTIKRCGTEAQADACAIRLVKKYNLPDQPRCSKAQVVKKITIATLGNLVNGIGKGINHRKART